MAVDVVVVGGAAAAVGRQQRAEHDGGNDERRADVETWAQSLVLVEDDGAEDDAVDGLQVHRQRRREYAEVP